MYSWKLNITHSHSHIILMQWFDYVSKDDISLPEVMHLKSGLYAVYMGDKWLQAASMEAIRERIHIRFWNQPHPFMSSINWSNSWLSSRCENSLKVSFSLSFSIFKFVSIVSFAKSMISCFLNINRKLWFVKWWFTQMYFYKFETKIFIVQK